MVFLTEAELKESWRLLEPGGAALTHGQAGIALLECIDATRGLGRVLRALRLGWLVGAIDRGIKLARPVLSYVVPKVPPTKRPPA